MSYLRPWITAPSSSSGSDVLDAFLKFYSSLMKPEACKSIHLPYFILERTCVVLTSSPVVYD